MERSNICAKALKLLRKILGKIVKISIFRNNFKYLFLGNGTYEAK